MVKTIAIGQSVRTTDDVTFNNITATGYKWFINLNSFGHLNIAGDGNNVANFN